MPLLQTPLCFKFKHAVCVIAMGMHLTHCFAKTDLEPPVQVQINAGFTRLDLQEPGSKGQAFSSEKGTLPTAGLALKASIDPQWSLKLLMNRAQGSTQYEGRTQLGLPLKTTSLMVLQDTQLQISRAWPAHHSQAHRFEAGLGLLFTSTDRDILPTIISAPLREKLNNHQLGLLLAWQPPQQNLFNIPVQTEVSMHYFKTIKNKLSVNSYGRYDPIDLNPGNGHRLAVSGKATLTLSENSQIGALLRYETLRTPSSATVGWPRQGVVVAGVRYPGSIQKRLNAEVFYQYNF